MPSCFSFSAFWLAKYPEKTLDRTPCLYYNNKFLTKFLFDNPGLRVVYLYQL